MKKLLHILFATIYLFLTTGLTITAHYCGGEVESISLSRTLNDKDPCDDCKTSCCDPCCEDEVQTIKLTDQHTVEAKFKQELIKVVLTVNFEELTESSDVNQKSFIYKNQLTNLNSPPTHLLNCTFLI